MASIRKGDVARKMGKTHRLKCGRVETECPGLYFSAPSCEGLVCGGHSKSGSPAPRSLTPAQEKAMRKAQEQMTDLDGPMINVLSH